MRAENNTSRLSGSVFGEDGYRLFNTIGNFDAQMSRAAWLYRENLFSFYFRRVSQCRRAVANEGLCGN